MFDASGAEDEPKPLKSSPCVDALTGWMWFGSHDEHLYAVDILVCKMMGREYRTKWNWIRYCITL